jgi:hypothetical protein
VVVPSYAGDVATRSNDAEWRVNRDDVEWDELFATTREPEVIDPAVRAALIRAINSKRLIRYATRDDTRPRSAEPHVYGRGGGWDRVLLHPDYRDPLSGSDWRLIKAADVTSIEVLEETFQRRTLPHHLDPDNPRARQRP